MSKQQTKTEWLYGKHEVKAAVLNLRRKIVRLVLLPQCEDFLEELGKISIAPEIVDKNFFISHFGAESIHQGCAVLAEELPEVFLEDLIDEDERPFVFLDQVTDPQNIGSILRASAVFGAKAVVLPENNSPSFNATIAKTSSGAAEIVPLIKVKNLVQSMKMLKERGYWCLGLDERPDKSIYKVDLRGKFVLVIGSEGKGMRRLTRENCDFLVNLPSFGAFTTLNAAQAATVALYELLRQKSSASK